MTTNRRTTRNPRFALLVAVAGFVLDAESNVLAVPDDTRDWNIFIDERTRRDKTDRSVLRFVKPKT